MYINKINIKYKNNKIMNLKKIKQNMFSWIKIKDNNVVKFTDNF